LSICVTFGIFFFILYGWPILAIGALGLFSIYTPWLNRIPLLCLIAPGLVFGALMVNGAYSVSILVLSSPQFLDTIAKGSRRRVNLRRR
jgi:1,4-dihydroxy-2-naphthoate polyprenyltransferase